MLDINIHEKRFKKEGKAILQACQFSVAPGELIAIVGPSGAGKSTLLRLIAGLDREFSGTINLDNQKLVQHESIGIVFQKDLLMPWLTILDNICLILGHPSKVQQQKAIKILEEVGLGDTLHHFPHQLSGGMQRRVALARAFVIAPKLLLMDEPFGSLDEPNVMILHALLKKLRQQTKPTTIFVTHHLPEAITLADQIVFMSKQPGHVLESIKIALPYARDLHSPEVKALAENILQKYPHILKGRI